MRIHDEVQTVCVQLEQQRCVNMYSRNNVSLCAQEFKIFRKKITFLNNSNEFFKRPRFFLDPTILPTFLPVLDYGDVVYQHASCYLLASLDALYHSQHITVHCIRVAWSQLTIRRTIYWCLLIYKAILGHLPSYLCCFIQQKSVGNYLRSQTCYNLCTSCQN